MKWIQSETNIPQNTACVKAIWYFRYRNVIAFCTIFFFLAKEVQFFWYLIFMTPWEIIHFQLQVAARFQIQHRWQDSKPPTPIITEIHRKITEMKKIVKKEIFLLFAPFLQVVDELSSSRDDSFHL